MAKKNTAASVTEVPAGEAAAAAPKAPQGIVLPNGVRRIDYIRDAFYNEGKPRGEIRKAINTMLEEAGRADEQISFQIVFSATKTKEDPRLAPKLPAEAAPAEGGDAPAAE